MKILVTGGAGFIGSHVADAYVEAGHSVAIMDDLSTGREDNISPRARFYRVDVRDAERVEKVFRDERFDLVNHHAAQMNLRRSVADPVHDASVNILGALSVLEACVKTGVSRVIFASSGGAIYGEQRVFPAHEEDETSPVSPYGVAKLATEKYLFCYKSVHSIQSVSLRYANVYGPRQNPEGEAGVVAIFTTKMLAGEEPLINGDGTQTRDYVYVADVVRANLLALRYEGSTVFNIGTGKETTVNQIFDLLKHNTGSTSARIHGPAKKGEQLRSALSHERITSALGWRPMVTLEEGLQSTMEYFRNRKGSHVSSTGH